MNESLSDECVDYAAPRVPQGINQSAVLAEDITAPTAPNKSRQIGIRELSRGYIIDVGCQSFAFESTDLLLIKLGEYLKNPEATEKKWYAGKLF